MSRIHLSHNTAFSPEQVETVRALINARAGRLEYNSDREFVAQSFFNNFLPTLQGRQVEATVECSTPYYGRSGYSVDTREGDVLEDVSRFAVQISGWKNINVLRALATIVNEEELYSQFGSENPVDPTAFAASAFYAARPVLFRKLVRTGALRIGVKPRDTFTTASWQVLRDAGLVVEDWDGRESLQGTPEQWASALNATSTPAVIAEVDPDLERILAEEEEIDRQNSAQAASNPVEGDALDRLNRDGLRQFAARVNLPGRGSMTAPVLRQALRDAGFTNPDEVPAEVV